MEIEKLAYVDHTNEIDQSRLKSNSPDSIIIHGNHSYPTFSALQAFHKSKGWEGVGYHLFMDVDGEIHQARPFDKEGAHALGFNFNPVGICFYSENGSLPYCRRSHAKDLVSQVRDDLEVSRVIPHTLAQIFYINGLLLDADITFQFPELEDIANLKFFLL